jgi:SAM-dependent methyltransferase
VRQKNGDDEPLSAGWERSAEDWARWACKPGHDSYWRFHRDAFFALLPAPAGLTLEIGCGEGRVARDLASIGHRVVGVERSLTLVRLGAAAATPRLVLADAARLPLRDASFDLVVAFMSLQDMDDMRAAVMEVARVLLPGGCLCLAAVHPINAAGQFQSMDDTRFVIEGNYFERRRYTDTVERDGLRMTFHQRHWTLEDYFAALEAAGLLTEAVREPVPGTGSRWDRIPLFLNIRASKPGSDS